MDRMAETGVRATVRDGSHHARRRVAMLAVSTLLALSVAPAGPVGAQDASFSVWLGGILAQATPGSPLRQWYDEQVTTFEQAHPGVTVETVLQDPDASKQVAGFRAAFGAGDGPDVAMMYPGGFTTTLASSLLDLSQVAPDVVAQYPPDLLRYGCEGFDCGGKPVLLAPSDFSGWVFAYDTDIFDQVGIQAPIATWDDLLAAGQKLKDAGFTPFQMGNRDGYISDAYLSNMETSFLTSEDLTALLAGQLPLTDEKFVKPLRLWADLYAKGFVNEDACTLETIASQQDFTAGKAATIATYDTANVAKAMGDKVAAMPWPAIDGSTTAGAAAQVGQGWVITRFAEDQALAAAFLAQVTSADAQSRALEVAGFPPANPGADASKASDPLSAAGVEQWTKNFKTLSLDSILPIETQTDYFKETAQALCGQKSPEDAMAAVQATFEGERGG
jgi:ABC-type glycerol-3-phosphate transport system substrate-binding protein